MERNDAIREIASILELVPGQDASEAIGVMAEKINDLLLNDFTRLVSILYRVDVDEAKLKKILNENPDTDAGVIIANLLIERQVEKTKTRQANSGNSKDVEGNEGW